MAGMRRGRDPRLCGHLAPSILLLAAASGCATSGGPEWGALFNGEDLSGFHEVGQAVWRVEGGEIVGRQGEERPGGGWLVTDRTFGDFELELEFKTSYGANSGVVIRDPKCCEGTPHRDGYEVQIVRRTGDRYPTGSIRGLVPALRGHHREGKWNRLRIAARGPRLEVHLNGEKVAEAEEVRSLRGAIGLQVASGSIYRRMWVRFRRIRVREFGTEAEEKPPEKPREGPGPPAGRTGGPSGPGRAKPEPAVPAKPEGGPPAVPPAPGQEGGPPEPPPPPGQEEPPPPPPPPPAGKEALPAEGAPIETGGEE